MYPLRKKLFTAPDSEDVFEYYARKKIGGSVEIMTFWQLNKDKQGAELVTIKDLERFESDMVEAYRNRRSKKSAAEVFREAVE